MVECLVFTIGIAGVNGRKRTIKENEKKEKLAEGLVAARETLRRVLLYSPNCLHNLFSEGRQIVYLKYSSNGKSAALVSM